MVKQSHIENVKRQSPEEQPSLSEDQSNRIWDHGKHAESVFLNQLNFFLIFESLLLGGAIEGIVIHQQIFGKPVLIGITIFGCLITLFWLCVQYGQGHLFEKLKTRMASQLPEYGETLKQRGENREFYKLIEFTTNLKFQAISIPGMVAFAWLGLLIYILYN